MQPFSKRVAVMKKVLPTRWAVAFTGTNLLHKSFPFWILLLLADFPTKAADLVIDSFVTRQSAPGAVSTRNTADGSDILGGERDIDSFLTLSVNGTVPNQLRLSYPSSGLNGPAGATITYDGNDNNPSG